MAISRRTVLGASLGASAASLLGAARAYAEVDEIEAITNNLSTPVQVAGAPFRSLRLDERMAHYHVPGVSICRFREGAIQWARGFGAGRGDGAAIDSDTLFQAASVSKPITAATALCLADRGALDVDADVQRYLGDWTLPRDAGVGDAPVTVRMLLSHTAGVSVSGFRGYPPGSALPTLDDILLGRAPANSEPIRVLRAPGGEADYSGGGYVLVQRIVENVTGAPFAEAAHACVLEPAGMTRSAFVQPPPDARLPYSAIGHDGEGRPLPGGFVLHPELAPAGLWSTPSDLARFALAYKRAHRGEPGAFLSQDAARLMATRQSGIWAVGFELIGEGDPWAVYHTGSNAGFKTFLLAELGADSGAVVMTNADNGSSLYQEILAGMAVAYGWPHLGPRTAPMIALSAAALEQFAGAFHMSEPIEADFIVTAASGRLIVEVPGFLPAADFFPGSETNFFDLTGSNVSFERDAGGRVVTLVWEGGIRATRRD